MSLVLNTNLNSLIAQNALTASGSTLATALQQLSTGLRINTAADDPAGYAIVQGLTSQINGLSQAAQNANDGVSLTQTAAGALSEITNDLQTMRDLAVESLNATNSSQDRADLNQQFSQLQADIQNVATTTNFNGVNLLDGSFSAQQFQVGPNKGQTIQVASIASAQTSALGATAGFVKNITAAQVAAGAAGVQTVTTSLTSGGTTTTANYSLNAGASIASDASVLAAAINNAGINGLTAAVAGTGTVATGTTAAVAGASGNADSVTINGTVIALTNTGNSANNLAEALADINGVSAVTGVTAAVNAANALTLSNTTGANIVAKFTTGGAATATDYGLGTIAGAGVNVTTSDALNITYSTASGTTGTVDFGGSGTLVTNAATNNLAATGTAVSALDVNDVTDANAALVSIDAALQQIASSGAALGAYQNRFQAAITGINTDSTNLTSARSGIQDTNYAQATSSLTQAQILQQAGTAMVAQANTIPQNVLTLIQALPH
jgi:flagellin